MDPILRIVPAILLSLLCILGLAGCSATEEPAGREIVYAGTFEGRGSEGLYVYSFDRETGRFNRIQTVRDRIAPDFQALHPGKRYLYSVSDTPFTDESDHGTVSAYRIDQETGKLSLINEQSVQGPGPAHVSVDPGGRFVYVSNYSGGNLSVFQIAEDGRLSPAVEVVQHEGRGAHETRQQAPHVHSAVPSADGRFLYVSDLGTDRIMIYKVHPRTGALSPAEMPYAEAVPGSGPRHFTIHPNGSFAYSAQELTSTVAAFQVDSATGALTKIQRLSMLPEGYEEQGNSAADIHISPDGRFLYASNRGHDSLVIYSIDPDSGTLSLVGHASTQGAHPRNFMIDRKGDFVLAANRDNDNVVLLQRNKETGQLQYSGQQLQIPMPVCLTQLILE
ncbi:lactonase family protein [Fodinibius sediminis]|uniref:6-phosphogluconolactonase n=1 Tax=Fodinibius sediminis TaxID=1214077 RepID=A0A521CG39_9BACT|nr:lactonase family protein [Fodinibius sediminis]SMO58379.1 6-phosphogluconolactonase [Fodinibius sediminis]